MVFRRAGCIPLMARAAATACTLMIGVASSARADDVADFYRGKTINIVVGFNAGGSYDSYARLLAGEMGKYIPGKPQFVVQNMPGAGSLRAGVYLQKVAPRDGTYFGTISSSAPVGQLLDPKPLFDAAKVAWIGSATDDNSVCMFWHTSQIKNWKDMLATPFILAGEGSSANSDMMSFMLRNLFGAKMKLVTGYPGMQDISLAMEREEVDGVCGMSWRLITAAHPDWVHDKKLLPVLQLTMARDPALADVPAIAEMAQNEKQMQMLRLLVAPQESARAFFASDEIPPGRLAALRKAFDETVADPIFIAEAEKMMLPVAPMTGEKIQSLITQLYATPKSVQEKTAKAITD